MIDWKRTKKRDNLKLLKQKKSKNRIDNDAVSHLNARNGDGVSTKLQRDAAEAGTSCTALVAASRSPAPGKSCRSNPAASSSPADSSIGVDCAAYVIPVI